MWILTIILLVAPLVVGPQAHAESNHIHRDYAVEKPVSKE